MRRAIIEVWPQGRNGDAILSTFIKLGAKDAGQPPVLMPRGTYCITVLVHESLIRKLEDVKGVLQVYGDPVISVV